jgi:16S rRNA (uracil1498-N3)-methyltransferase
LPKEQSHYLLQVMRAKDGAELALFNAEDGEWLGQLVRLGKKDAAVMLEKQLRAPEASPDIWLVFAPIKSGRIDFLVEKATELGARALWPVRTERTIVSRVNEERLRKGAVEAAEQTERLDVPDVHPYQPLGQLLKDWPQDRPLFYGEELGSGGAAQEVLAAFPAGTPCGLLVGPEGGFSAREQEQLRSLPFCNPLSLGPRILRADTAALAGLTCLQLWLGDWEKRPRS